MKNNKFGVIFYHKDIQNIYKDKWIDKCIKSIFDQSMQEFSIYEINYGGSNYSIFENKDLVNRDHKFYSNTFKNHAEAMNFILDESFKDGCDFVFNTNLDDFYD